MIICICRNMDSSKLEELYKEFKYTKFDDFVDFIISKGYCNNCQQCIGYINDRYSTY